MGIHSRRGDHLAYEREKGNPELKASYFLEAMNMYRQKFKKQHQLVFLFISDEVDWGYRKLAPRVKEADLFFVSKSEPMEASSVGHDLAIMARCNHSIISHGTFSYWAGFLAGGAVITPHHFPQYRKKGIVFDPMFKRHPLDEPLPRLHLFV